MDQFLQQYVYGNHTLHLFIAYGLIGAFIVNTLFFLLLDIIKIIKHLIFFLIKGVIVGIFVGVVYVFYKIFF